MSNTFIILKLQKILFPIFLLPFCYFKSMSTLVIKSVPKEIHQFLKESARAHRRSLTQEVITILEQLVAVQKKEEKISVKKN